MRDEDLGGFSAGGDDGKSMTGLPLLWLKDGSESTDLIRSDLENSSFRARTFEKRKGIATSAGPWLGTFVNLSGLLTIAPSSGSDRDLRAVVVVVLWSLTSPYHFSSPAIDSVSVGRRTDKGMCMTLPTDNGDNI